MNKERAKRAGTRGCEKGKGEHKGKEGEEYALSLAFGPRRMNLATRKPDGALAEISPPVRIPNNLPRWARRQSAALKPPATPVPRHVN